MILVCRIWFPARAGAHSRSRSDSGRAGTGVGSPLGSKEKKRILSARTHNERKNRREKGPSHLSMGPAKSHFKEHPSFVSALISERRVVAATLRVETPVS